MIPTDKLDQLALIAAEAFALADEGHPFRGYLRLKRGQAAAEQDRRRGDEWGAELVSLWEDVLGRFTAQYGDPWATDNFSH